MESPGLATVVKTDGVKSSLKEMAQIQQKDVRPYHTESLINGVLCVD